MVYFILVNNLYLLVLCILSVQYLLSYFLGKDSFMDSVFLLGLVVFLTVMTFFVPYDLLLFVNLVVSLIFAIFALYKNIGDALLV